MRSRARSLLYLGLYDPQATPGLQRKVAGTLRAAEAAGYRTRAWSEPFRGWPPLLRALAEIARSRESHIILRSAGWANALLAPGLLLARLRGQTVIVDVPTPSRVAVDEIWTSSQSWWRRVRTVALLFLSGPWPLWPASRILQYADEGWWFECGNAGRTVKVGNGVDVQGTPRRAHAPDWPAGELRLVGVATLAPWQGYDRVIRAVHALQSDAARPFDVHFTVVGEGPALDDLKRLARELALGDRVTFTGTLVGDALNREYARAHLAVGAVAIHRKGLTEASPLKAREYCAVGMPFLASGADVDFPGDVPFRLVVSPTDDIDSVVAALRAFGPMRAQVSDAAIRQYAEARLDFTHKIAGILG